jgi:Zn ribbon nucleic-acid-binding protein
VTVLTCPACAAATVRLVGRANGIPIYRCGACGWAVNPAAPALLYTPAFERLRQANPAQFGLPPRERSLP